MKKILTVVIVLCSFVFSNNLNAQMFTVTDTVWVTATLSSQIVHDNISVGISPVVVKWQVISSNFPSDWLHVTTFCDNMICYPWSIDSTHSFQTSGSYAAGSSGDFHMVQNLGATSVTTKSGTYYITLRMSDTGATTTAYATFVVTYPTTIVPSVNNVEQLALYPNPATNEVNVLFDANADIKTATICNIIGNVMTVYKVNGDSANFSVENLPSGIYFVRLYNSQGVVVANRKFTKQ